MTLGGFSIWDGPVNSPVPPELDDYVDAGEPPILVTLGTSAATDAGERFARIRSDLAERGLRSIVLAGNDANAAALADEPGVVPFAPLTTLLPRCRAAVVSGALGSVAAAVSAGIPTVVHPQLWDQFWHGRQVRTLGVGALARSVGQVADRVESVLASHVAQAASELANSIAGEDGVAALAGAVDRALARPR